MGHAGTRWDTVGHGGTRQRGVGHGGTRWDTVGHGGTRWDTATRGGTWWDIRMRRGTFRGHLVQKWSKRHAILSTHSFRSPQKNPRILAVFARTKSVTGPVAGPVALDARCRPQVKWRVPTSWDLCRCLLPIPDMHIWSATATLRAIGEGRGGRAHVDENMNTPPVP